MEYRKTLSSERAALYVLLIFLLSLLFYIFHREDYLGKIFDHLNSSSIESFTENPNFKNRTNMFEIYTKKTDIVMLGNSLTYRCDWNELLNRSDIINRGIGHDVTEGFLNRLDCIYQVEPRYCYIMGGINDLIRGYPHQLVVKNINNMVDSLNKRNIKPIIQSIFYCSKKNMDLNNSIRTTNELIEKLCQKKNVQYLDLNELMGNISFLKEEYSLDGVHLTPKAYLEWGAIISKDITKRDQ